MSANDEAASTRRTAARLSDQIGRPSELRRAKTSPEE
jgi:hypothetical protein